MASNFSLSQTDSISDIILSHICVWIGDGMYGGWKRDLLVENMSVTENTLLLCEECKGVAREACTLTVEGDQSLRCSNCLPLHNIPGMHIIPAKINRTALKEKHAMCPFPDCKWVGEIMLIEDHLEVCGELPVPCPLECRTDGAERGRITRIKRNHIRTHEINECPLRLEQCEACKREVKVSEINLHQQNCEFILVPCPNDCNESDSGCEIKMLRRNEVTFHRNKECPLEFVACSYFDDGCEVRVKRMDLNQHQKDFFDKHLKLCQENTKQQLRTYLRKQANLEREIISLKSRINELESSTGHAPLFGMVEMKIENVRHKIQTKAEMYSSPFFAGRYKFQVCIDWDCENSGNIACYVFIMRGDRDNDLEWPIRYKYTFIILNQNNRGDYVRSYKITENDMITFASSFQRPNEERNAGYGLKDFISHDECCRERHTRNDCLIFQANIEVILSDCPGPI